MAAQTNLVNTASNRMDVNVSSSDGVTPNQIADPRASDGSRLNNLEAMNLRYTTAATMPTTVA